MTTKRKKAMKQAAPMLNIAGPNVAAVAEARKAINDILRAPHVDNGTKVEALKALHGLCAVHNTAISGCTFSGSND
jgi:hypothetical protein